MDGISESIDRLERENRKIREDLAACVMSANYEELAEQLNLPGADEQIAVELDQKLFDLNEELRSHFGCEEATTLKAFLTWNIPELILPVEDIITEHERILKTLAELRKAVAELFSYEIGLSLRPDNAGQIRRRLAQFSQMLESHAGKEESLFREARRLEKKRVMEPT